MPEGTMQPAGPNLRYMAVMMSFGVNWEASGATKAFK